MEVLPRVSSCGSLPFSSYRRPAPCHAAPASLPILSRSPSSRLSAHPAGSLLQLWKAQDERKRRLAAACCTASSSDVNNRSSTAPAFFPPWLDAFYRFTRPYSVVGPVVGAISVSFLAVETLEDISLRFVIGMVQAIALAILSQIYVAAVNQVFDVEIDKVNKPYLPLASGELSLNMGISLTIIVATLNFALAAYTKSKPLMWYATLAFLTGSGYSLEFPFLRWKQWSLSSIFTVVVLGALLVPLCIYPHIQSFVLGRSLSLSRPVIFLTGFLCILNVVIAVFKDIPDLEGDKAHGMQNYTVQLGQTRVFWLCIYTLLGAYGGAMIVGLMSKTGWSKMAMVLGHAIPASILWHRATISNPKDKKEMQSFYMFIWKLLYAEYFLAHFMR